MDKLRVLSLFSGVGAPEMALRNLNIDYELIGFSEIDKWAIKSYCEIHGVNEDLNLGDITKIEIDKLPCEIDLITHGSPCQDFSVAGKGKGGEVGTGTRSSLMWNTVEIVKHCKPKYVLWENVKNVISKKHKPTFDKYINSMEEIGYKNYYKVLNAKDYGVSQNRERIFVVSTKDTTNFNFPETQVLKVRLKDLLEDKVDEKFYINNEKTDKLIQELKSDIEYGEVYTCITPDRVNKRQNGRRFKNNDEPMFTITTQDRNGVLETDKLLQVCNLKGGKWDRINESCRRVYSELGISPTVHTCQGGNTEPKVAIYEEI